MPTQELLQPGQIQATGKIKTMSISTVQLIYGGIAAFSSVLFLLLAREKPATPPSADGEKTRALMFNGLKHALKIKPFWLYLLVSFIGLVRLVRSQDVPDDPE